MTTPPVGPRAPAAYLLMKAARWFDRGSLAALERAGWPRMSPAQSLLFANLDETGTSPSELARRLGQSRQATQDLVARLCAQGLLEVVPDPHRRGGRLVRLTGSGRRLVQEAYAILVEMESALGAPVVDRARTVLAELLDLQERADREGRPHT